MAMHGHNLFESSKLAGMHPIQHQTIVDPCSPDPEQYVCVTLSVCVSHVLEFSTWQFLWHICQAVDFETPRTPCTTHFARTTERSPHIPPTYESIVSMVRVRRTCRTGYAHPRTWYLASPQCGCGVRQ